ncbi:MAG: hypothetical protein D6731_21850 [Planctomycetota bacterium]|nr:MAG: hypothetical protein D6731_21850 [Planctomycetota bacterium]
MRNLVALTVAGALVGCASAREEALQGEVAGYRHELERSNRLHAEQLGRKEEELAQLRTAAQAAERERERAQRELAAAKASRSALQASLDAALARLREREEELARLRREASSSPAAAGATQLIREQARQIQALRSRLAEVAAGKRREPPPELVGRIRGSYLDLQVPVAWVDGEPLRRRDFVEFLYRDVGAAGFLDLYVNRHLILREARRRGLEIDAADVEYWIGEQWISQSREAGSEEKLLAALAQRGFTREAWEARLRYQARAAIAAQRLIDLDRSGPGRDAWEERVFEEYRKAYSETVSARHIFVPLERFAPPERVKAARAHLAQAERALQKGVPFEEVALRYSYDAKSRELGGALGSFDRKRFAELPQLNTALFSLPVGRVSKPVRSRIGLHIVRVDERKPPRKAFGDVRAEIEQRLRAEPPSQGELDALVKRLRARARIKTNLVFDDD